MADITIVAGDLVGPYQVLGPIRVRVTAKTLFSKDRTTEEADVKLRAEAVRRGANAVINVTYDRGISATSWKALTARGVAVVTSSQAAAAPVQPAGGPPSAPAPAGWQPDPSQRHQLRYWDGQRWTEHVSDGGSQSVDPV